MKRRKPDLMLVLAVLIGSGVFFTGLTQASGSSQGAPAAIVSAR